MEPESVENTLSTDEIVAETSDDSEQANTERDDIISSNCSDRSPSRPIASGLRRIQVAPASGDDVIHSHEPPEAIQCSWRPVKPGYAANVGGAVLIERTVEVEDFDHDDTDSSFRLAIPVMSHSVAVLCAVCNVISPGLGQLDIAVLFSTGCI